MFRTLFNKPYNPKTTQQINEFISTQTMLDNALSKRLALAGINIDAVPLEYKEQVAMLPSGCIGCVGNGTTIQIDNETYAYIVKHNIQFEPEQGFILKSGDVLLERHRTTNRIVCYYSI